MELQHRLGLTKLEAKSEVVAEKNQAELAKLEALLVEQEVSDLPSCEKGVTWPHKHDIQPPEVQIATLPSLNTTGSNLDIGPWGNLPLTLWPSHFPVQCANKALNLTARDDEETYSPEVTKTVRKNVYVDDVFKSVPTPEPAIHLASDLIKLLKECGFRLTKICE